jgi:hypothetical protein
VTDQRGLEAIEAQFSKSGPSLEEQLRAAKTTVPDSGKEVGFSAPVVIGVSLASLAFSRLVVRRRRQL